MTVASPLLRLAPGLGASPRALFIFGALMFPPFLMQRDLLVRACAILVYVALNAAGGRRVRVAQSVVVAAGIVLFNLVIPTGKVLLAPLGLPVTQGALVSGLMKATAMTGLIFLSQFCIRPGLHLPGRIGGLIGRSFYYFEAIMAQRGGIDRADIIGSIDRILLSLQRPQAEALVSTDPHVSTDPRLSTDVTPSDGSAPSPAGAPLSRTGGLALLLVLVCLSWGAYVVTSLRGLFG